ncbi:SET domain-containing protein-lysine N-methyltransferase [Gloeocapsopsis crepidinum]|uniref:SET domain-containing protein-lysine N-methyltransferase n=1 Tax=Gloeocapsopsis crepidinum TaxID=693223 RepID=UPI00187DF8E5
MLALSAASYLLTNEKFYIANSKFGQGLFAKKDIRVGENILIFTGGIIDFDQAILKAPPYEGDALQIGKSIYVNLEPPGRFVNHSCDPNAGIKNDIELVALRNIKAGEEIYFDYSTTMDEDYWSLQCGCGSINCRKVIKDFKHLPYHVKRKYLDLNIVQKFIAVQYPTTAKAK